MDIKPSQPKQPSILPRGEMAAQLPSNKALPANWQINTLVEALVLQKTLSGKLILDLKGVQVEVSDPPPLDFKKGQRWLLQLVSQTPLLVFKLLHALNTDKAEMMTIQQALRTIAPKQQPMPPLLANVHALAQQIKSSGSLLPREVQQSIQNFYQQLPRLENLKTPMNEPPRLKDIMARIAPVLESQLAALSRNESSPALSSVRTQLLQLAAQLHISAQQTSNHPQTFAGKNIVSTDSTLASNARTTTNNTPQNQLTGYSTSSATATQQSVRLIPQAQPQLQPSHHIVPKSHPEHILPELARQVEGVLARGQVQQLNSLHAEQQGRPMWAMELPLRTDQGIDLFDFRIERDKHSNEEYTEVMPWSVTLAFDLNGLGPIRAVVSLRGEQISSRFWAERTETNLLFNQHLDLLKSQLNHAGINVGKLECQSGTLPESDENLEPVLLDEKV